MRESRASLGARIRARRPAAGLTAREFAARVGASEGHLRNVESGCQPGSADFVRRLADALDVRGEELGAWEVAAPSPPATRGSPNTLPAEAW